MSKELYSLTGTHGVRRYIWSILKSELGWDEANYEGMVPIITPSQGPEFQGFDAPYIVYNYTSRNLSDRFINADSSIFVVYSDSDSDINAAINVIKDKLNRRDDSAQDVNAYAHNLGVRYSRFDYKTIWMTSMTGPTAPVSEGGRMDGNISLEIHYTIDSDNTGSRVERTTPFSDIDG